MHFNAQKAYNRLFPEIDITKDCLSLDDLEIIASHFFEDINFESKEVKDFLLSLDRNFKPTQYYKKNISDFINPSRKRHGSIVCVEYWTSRGWSEEYAKNKVSMIQKERTIFGKTVWMKRGFSEDEAKLKVIELQTENSKKSNVVFDVHHWISLGYSHKEAEEMVSEYTSRRSSFDQQFWVNRGYSEEEALKKIKEIASSTSLNSLISKYGEEDGRKRRDDLNKKIYSFKPGKDNPQYGKSAPKGSGSSVTGYYKQYYFRSLHEYFTIKYFEDNNISFICNDVSSNKIKNKVVISYYNVDGIEKKTTYQTLS